ncbi:phosphatidate cytidylyltransferase [Bifidobacterium indicum]|uniref:phosphatidate cytidylyltransferase n=1 Tax=Bifidobacterium indicum TaxID=1691 RepID=UPI0026254E6E|nr:phosphatidate cytidylyltransferase [uncultured Bifidobacterium sp.]
MSTKENPAQKAGQDAVASLNRRTGRNMPQAVATGALLVVIILACILVRIDAFIFLIVIFMTLGLWELRVDFATVGMHIPVVELWVCSAATMLASFYAPDHVAVMTVGVLVTALVGALAATRRHHLGGRLVKAVDAKLSGKDADTTADASYEAEGGRSQAGSLANVGVTILTVIYITLLACLITLPTTFGGHPAAHAFMVIFLPALSDIGGLLFGSLFGRHKISPRISPGKSLEGLTGSMLCCLVGALVIFAATYPMADWGRIWWVALVMGIMVGATGTFGDLSASLIKRDLGIKDMGHLLKGHGGVLDRVDSILMSAPFITLVLLTTGL